MFTNKKIAIMVILFISFLSSINYSQEIGQIFDSKEADELFGPVLEKMSINADELKSILSSTDNKIMFRLENNEYTILGDNRKLLYCSDNFVEQNQVFHLYSKSKVIELLNKGNKQTVILENRQNVFSITVGNYTLEKGAPCPPNCG